MASERAKAIEHELHGGHVMPGEALKNTGGCRCPRCVKRRCELIDLALQEERREAEKKTARECIKSVREFTERRNSIKAIAEKFGLEETS